MSKRKRVLLGVATIWPVFIIFSAFGTEIVMVALGQMSAFLKSLHYWGWLLPITVVEYYVVWGYYLKHVSKSGSLSPEAKQVWKNWIILAGLIVMPIYWYREVRS